MLTGLSRFWFAETAGIVPNHLLDTDVDDPPRRVEAARDGRTTRRPTGDRGRSTTARPGDDLPARRRSCPIEAVVRGYLAGSAGRSTSDHGHGLRHPAAGRACARATGCPSRSSRRRPRPSRASTTRTSTSTRWSSTSAATPAFVPPRSAGPIAEVIRDRALALYRYAAAIAARGGHPAGRHEVRVRPRARAWSDRDRTSRRSGGRADRAADASVAGRRPDDRNGRPIEDQLILIDEVLTPDSSRFWDAATYEPGRAAGELRQAVRARLARDAAVGQDRARARRCPTTSSRARAPATSRPSSGSPAPASSAISRRTSSPDEHATGSPSTSRPSRASSIRRAGPSRAASATSGSAGSAPCASAGGSS